MELKFFKLTLTGLFLLLSVKYSAAVPVMERGDKLRIREAVAISNIYGKKIWEGISKAPFAIILVTDSIEFLVYHPNPSEDFVLSERDTVLNADIFYRKRQYPKNLLATFPAVNGISCIVAGTTQSTHKNSTEWIITLLHEHFHQYVNSQPGYYQSVEKLDLSGGDQTGMWMLNYPFPYENSQVIEQYQKYTRALSNAISGSAAGKFSSLLTVYKRERKRLKKLLTASDYRYLSFQIWQEGIARYTEYKFLELLKDYNPAGEIAALPDFVSFRDYKAMHYQSALKQLTGLKLNADKRVCFYSLGFGEGVLLDKLNPAWRSKYVTEKFFTEKYSRRFK